MIVFSAAILIFRPGAESTPVVSTNNPDYNRSVSTDPSQMARDNSLRGLQDPADTSPIQENYITESGAAAPGTTVISVPKPSTAAVPDVKPAAKPAVKNKTESDGAKQTAAAASAPKKSYRDYWVQAGSFSTRERADGVKNTLNTKGISAIVSNQEINGNTYYRVRIGPYTSQNEADYWLAMVKSIDGFQDSQIWESQSFR